MHQYSARLTCLRLLDVARANSYDGVRDILHIPASWIKGEILSTSRIRTEVYLEGIAMLALVNFLDMPCSSASSLACLALLSPQYRVILTSAAYNAPT